MTERNDQLKRARDYPYPYPGYSFIWHNGEIIEFEQASTADRVPVLAVGSNRSPVRLDQKFLGKTNTPIPVQKAHLKDFDIFYAAQLAHYGSVPAMLQYSPKTTVELAVTWLDYKQLAIMHSTEGGYQFGSIRNIHLTYDSGIIADNAHLYIGKTGHLLHNSQPIALSEINSADRFCLSLNTAEVLEVVQKRVAPCLGIDNFILKIINEDKFRQKCSEILSQDAHPFNYPFLKSF